MRTRSHSPCFAAAGVAALAVGLLALPAGAADKRRNGPPGTPAPVGAIAPNVGFDAFQIVVERNIFNPSRSSRARSAPEEKPVRTDELSLVGVVQYDGDRIAVFDGSESAFRRGIREGESVADFRVARIAADGIELTLNDRRIALKVAQQLRRPEGGEWKVSASQVARAEPRTAAGNGSGPPRGAEPAAVEIPADASEVLKRLMQKREKQLKK